MKEYGKKAVGWLMAYRINDVQVLLVVSAKSKKDAAKKFEKAGYKVVDEKYIRHSCLVQYPGPKEVQEMPTMNWQQNKAVTRQ